MSNKTLHPATTVIPADFWVNRPVAYTADGFPIYPSFAPVAPTKEQVIADLHDELDNTAVGSPRYVWIEDQIERLTGVVTPRYTPANLDTLASILIQLATDQIEDQFGNPVDVSDLLGLFDGAVETDVVMNGRKQWVDVERTLASWVPSTDLQCAHNVEAFGASFEDGATDWSGANSDGLPVDVDGAYDVDNDGFFDRLGSSESLGFSECTEDFFTHNTTGEDRWG